MELREYEGAKNVHSAHRYLTRTPLHLYPALKVLNIVGWVLNVSLAIVTPLWVKIHVRWKVVTRLLSWQLLGLSARGYPLIVV